MEEVQHIHRSSDDITSAPYEILKLVVGQFQETRELLQLFNQLHRGVPIRDFEGLVNCVENGKIEFRDMRIPIRLLKDLIPPFIFPIEDERNLIERLSHVIRVLPAFAGFDSTKPANIQYISQVNFLQFVKEWLRNYSIPAKEYVIRIHDE